MKAPGVLIHIRKGKRVVKLSSHESRTLSAAAEILDNLCRVLNDNRVDTAYESLAQAMESIKEYSRPADEPPAAE